MIDLDQDFFRVEELAGILKISREKCRSMFKNQDGVIQDYSGKLRKNCLLIIPKAVVIRVLTRAQVNGRKT
jgi:hypothetical protein